MPRNRLHLVNFSNRAMRPRAALGLLLVMHLGFAADQSSQKQKRIPGRLFPPFSRPEVLCDGVWILCGLQWARSIEC